MILRKGPLASSGQALGGAQPKAQARPLGYAQRGRSLQHPYIPATDAEEAAMLERIGVADFEELVQTIPADLRLNGSLGLGPVLSELEVAARLGSLASLNRPAADGICFLGGGAYDHYSPVAVQAVASRSEFYTAYTPYQPEVSQGTLQAMYEFQSMVCEISGMDVANASLLDGASAAGEACVLALAATGRRKILIPETVPRAHLAVIETYLSGPLGSSPQGVDGPAPTPSPPIGGVRPEEAEIVPIASKDGRVDLDDLAAKSQGAAAVLVQSPNALGLVEDWVAARVALADDQTLLIASGDPLTLGLLASPGSCGADVYVGEGQSLGLPLSFGGPYLGLMAARQKYIRRLPGRIIGRTVDQTGKTGFVMVLRTREQDIRREKATSNICTNQGLMALWATLYLALLGKGGIGRLAELCFQKSQYLADKIADLPGYELPFGRGFVKEFVVRPPVPAEELRGQAEAEGFFLGTITWRGEGLLQLAVTEKRTRQELDRLVEFLKRFGPRMQRARV